MKRPVILVIDDEVSHFDVVEALFNRQDYQLYYAASGEDAIDALDAFQPDLILLDILMPDTNGIEVCRRIKALPQWQSVPIIIVTIVDTKRVLTSCVNAGADDWIIKPFDSIELRTRVHSMLSIKKQRDENKVLYRIQTNTVNLLESTLDELRGSLASQQSYDELFHCIEQSTRRLENLTVKFQIYMELELAANQLSGPPPHTTTSLQIAITISNTLAQKYHRSQDLILQIEAIDLSLSTRYLSIIFNELVENALKFSPSGTPITISSQVSESIVIVSIHNLGQGITDAQIAMIDNDIQFEPTAHSTTPLGLKIVKRILNLVNGQFVITGSAQQGTIVQFTVSLASH